MTYDEANDYYLEPLHVVAGELDDVVKHTLQQIEKYHAFKGCIADLMKAVACLHEAQSALEDVIDSQEKSIDELFLGATHQAD